MKSIYEKTYNSKSNKNSWCKKILVDSAGKRQKFLKKRNKDARVEKERNRAFIRAYQFDENMKVRQLAITKFFKPIPHCI